MTRGLRVCCVGLLLAGCAGLAAGCGGEALAGLTGLIGNSQNGALLSGRGNGGFGPAGFGGGPGPGGPGMFGAPRIFAALDLTDAQEDQADELFHQMHKDIRTLHRAARDQVRALLTEEQQTKLDELRRNGPQAAGLERPAVGQNPRDLIAEYLGLSDEQQTQIEAIHETTRDQVEARHEQARQDFRALLTAVQQTRLDELEAERPEFPGFGFRGGPPFGGK